MLDSEPLKTIMKTEDIDEQVSIYTQELTDLVDKHAPERTKTITLRPTSPWYTQELHDAKHLKRKLENKWQKTKLTVDHEIYREQCAEYNKLLQRCKSAYYTEKVESCQNDSKSLFRITKNLLGTDSEAKLPKNDSSSQLAQDFSDFFINKIEKIRTDISSEPNPVENYKEIPKLDKSLDKLAPTTPEEIKKIIQESPCKSCELDPIPTWLLKACIDELLPALTNIINSSLDQAYVPSEFKRSHIRPLLKKPDLDQDELKNYRPVSNLPFVSKVLEKVVDKRIESHLTSQNLHEQHKSAYRKHQSNETTHLKVQNDILQSLDRNEVTILVMLDLSAAFDTIDHETLLQRLETDFGITGKPLEWMTSYLTDRYQTVTVKGEHSNPVHMKYSVPQGSVLGPKNYIMYTKPVGSICRDHGLEHHFYADDSQLYMSFKPKDACSKQETLSQIEKCLEEIVSWMHQNMLKLNTDKTEVILFHTTHTKLPDDILVKVGTSQIKPSVCVKNLGARMDSKLDMTQHVNALCQSSYLQLRQIGKIRKYITTDATKTLVNALVTSKTDYCNSLLHGIPKCTLQKLQRVQHTAARIITKTPRFNHITPVLKELHWLPVHRRSEFKILSLTFKALHNQAPEYITKMLEVYIPGRCLRSASGATTLVVPASRTNKYGDRSFRTAAPTLWIKLPENVRSSSSLVAFKKALKTHLFQLTYST